jgi:hypothetical protein
MLNPAHGSKAQSLHKVGSPDRLRSAPSFFCSRVRFLSRFLIVITLVKRHFSSRSIDLLALPWVRPGACELRKRFVQIRQG